MSALISSISPLQWKSSVVMAVITALPYLCSQVSKQINYSSIPWLYRLAFLSIFILNLITVRIPGRFDGNMDKNGKVVIPWTTLFEPESWAFAIWGVIYLGEIGITSYAALFGKPEAVFRHILPYWIAGNAFQSLWCGVFRPEYRSMLWLPTILLASGSVSFGLMHSVLSGAISHSPDLNINKIILYGLRFPIALHTGWLAAASLLNLNAWMSVSNKSKDIQIAAAYLSAYLAGLVGLIATIRSGDPWIACTIAWALTAVATKSLKREDQSVSKEVFGSLSITESWISRLLIGSAAGVVIQPFLSKLF